VTLTDPKRGVGALPAAYCSMAWLLGETALPNHVDPSRTALVWEDRSLTYAELRDHALRLAAGLRSLGLQPGDRVATLLYNRGETFELYFASAYAGLTLVPINFRMAAREVELVLRDCGASVIVTDEVLAPVARSAASAIGPELRLVTLGENDYGGEFKALLASRQIAAADMAVTAVHLLLYTSGTTGRPKGVALSPTAIMWFALQQATFYPDMTPEMVLLLTGPTFNTAGINEQSIPTLLMGGTLVVQPSRGWRPERTSMLIDRFKVTHVNLFPVMLARILEADSHRRIEFASLRFVLTGGEVCPVDIISRFRRRWPHLSLAIGYGLTEVGVITLIRDSDIDRHPGSVGRSFGAQTHLVVDAVGRSVRPGEIGEIITAGPSLATGYWNAPELTASAIRDGWLWTGDLGRQDEDGYLYIEGRSKDMIISGGQNIFPAEIESALAEHEDLSDCAVIGVPDRQWGEAVCAVIVPKAARTVTEREVIQFVAARLATYKKPKYVVVLDDLPRNPAGKVRKNQLRYELRDIEQRREVGR